MMVEADREALIERLTTEQCSCVIYNEGMSPGTGRMRIMRKPGVLF